MCVVYLKRTGLCHLSEAKAAPVAISEYILKLKPSAELFK